MIRSERLTCFIRLNHAAVFRSTSSAAWTKADKMIAASEVGSGPAHCDSELGGSPEDPRSA